jgi:lipoprotein-releasing system permease protein
MPLTFEWFIGARYLRSRQPTAFISLITLLSVAGVTVGVMALIVVIAVMAGFESDLKGRMLSILPHLKVTADSGNLADHRAVAERVRSAAGVEAAGPYVESQVMIRGEFGGAGAQLKGVAPDHVLGDGPLAAIQALADSPETDSGRADRPGLVLGAELARAIGVAEGDSVYLISPRGALSPIGHIPAMRRFRVAGLFRSGMYEYDGALAFARMEAVQGLLRMGGRATGVEAWMADPDRAPAARDRLAAALGPDVRVRDWTGMNRSFFGALRLEKAAMFVILTLIVLVAAFNIANSLAMTVMEKTRDIAILKAMGATDRSIRRIFMFKGLAIGLVGTALGGALGVLLCWALRSTEFIQLPADVYYLTTIPVRLAGWDVAAIGAAALLICLLATLLPARQAARLNPVEAFRYE